MFETSLSVWFVCRLCRGSFGQVDAFIEHKKEKHFTQFQNTTSIVFEEMEHGPLYPLITSDGEFQLAEEISEPSIKVEVNDDDPVGPFSLGIIDEPNLDLVEPKSELITYESEIKAEDENSFFGLEQPEQNPYVLLQRMTSKEIQRALFPQQQSKLIKCEQTFFANSLEDPNSSDADSNTTDDKEFRKSTEIPPTPTILISTEIVHQFECKLCSKKSSKLSDIDVDAGHRVVHLTEMSPQHTDPGQDQLDYQTNTATTDGNIRAETETAHLRTGTGTVPIEIAPEALNPYPVQCNLCPETFNSLPDFEAHLEACVMLTKQRHRHCIPCNKTFRDAYGLNRHNSSRHSTPTTAKSNFTSKSANFKCQLCPKEFLTALLLKYHTQTHRSTSDNKTFAKSIATSRRSHHKSVHSPAKRPLNAYSEDNLENTSSNNIHKRHRVFYCPFNCGQSFAKNYNVKRHIGRKHPWEFGEGPDLVKTITIKDGVSDPFGSDEEIMEIEPETESRLEPVAPSMLQVILETGSRRKQVLERNSSPKSQYEPLFGPKSTAESNLETEPTVEPKSEIKPKLEPNSKTETNSDTEAASKPEPKSDTETKPKTEFLKLEHDSKPEPILESRLESNSEPSQVATVNAPADSELPEKPAFTCLHPNCSENFDTVANPRHHLIHFHIANDIENASTPAFALSTPEPESKPDPESSSLLSTSKEEDSDGPQRRKSLQSSNDSPFQCTIENCDKSFTRSDNLKRHIRRFHQLYDEAELQVMVTRTRHRGPIEMESRNRTSPAPFICPRMSCRKTFTRHDSVKRHMGRAHGSDEEIEVVTIDL